MILIADSGSTKTHWALIKSKQRVEQFESQGLNPYFNTNIEIETVVLKEVLPNIPESLIEKIVFFGAGCSSTQNCRRVWDALHGICKNASIVIQHDILGAAIAICGDKPGITGILGTGSNSCLYNGKEITSVLPSFGYLYGDEGSGGWIGKNLLGAYLKETMPEELRLKFYEKYPMELPEILTNLYNKPRPNQFLAQFSHFCSSNIDHPFIQRLVKDGFDEFLKNQILRHPGYEFVPIGFVGSVAFIFHDLLLEACKSFNLISGKVIKNPIEGLITYYSEKITEG